MAEKRDFGQEQLGFKATADIHSSMIRAGTLGRSRVSAGIQAGMKSLLRQRFGPMFGGDTTKIATVLRALGQQDAANWYDRFFAVDKDLQKKMKKMQQKGASTKDQTQKKEARSSTRESVVSNTAVLKNINLRLDVMSFAIQNIGEDVTDIKSLIMPKGITAFGRKGSESEDDVQFLKYSPLAPPGEQFRQVSQGGKITGKKPGKDFMQSAISQAAMQAAQLAFKIEKKDEEKAELRKKYQWTDKMENRPLSMAGSDPISALRIEMNKNFKQVFDILNKLTMKDGGPFGEGGWIDKLGDLGGALALFKSVKPFLKTMGRVLLGFGKFALRLGAVGLAGWLGYEFGKWLNEKWDISTKIVDAVFRVQEMISNFNFEDIKSWILSLPRRVVDYLNPLKRKDAEKEEAEMAAKSAKPATSPVKPTPMPEGEGGPRSRGGLRKQHKIVEGNSSGRTLVENAAKEAGIEGMHKSSLLAQVHHESGGFKRLEENLNYSAERLMQVFPKYYKSMDDAMADAGNPEKIAMRVYGSRSDLGNNSPKDGWTYRGRGYIQLTGKNNYKKYGDMVGVDLVNNPDLAAEPKTAANIAVAYYKDRVMNRGIEAENLAGVTKAIQGGSLGIKERGELMAMYSTAPTPMDSMKPTPIVPGSAIDQQSRVLTASATAQTPPIIISAPTMNTTQQTSQAPKMALAKAPSTTRDDSFVRASTRDSVHPVYA